MSTNRFFGTLVLVGVNIITPSDCTDPVSPSLVSSCLKQVREVFVSEWKICNHVIGDRWIISDMVNARQQIDSGAISDIPTNRIRLVKNY